MEEFKVDQFIKEKWNENNPHDKIFEENTWEMCRKLEQMGLLDCDDASVTALSIGPFRIASKLDPTRREGMVFFITTIIPAIFAQKREATFDETYETYILPFIVLLVNVMSRMCIIKEWIEWDLLTHIKKENKANRFPTEKDIIMSDRFKTFEERQIKESLIKLQNYKNVVGDIFPLISKDKAGKFRSEV